MKSKTKLFWILIGIGSALIIFLMILSNVINVGEKLRKINVTVEIIFYCLSALVIYFLIINPLRIILFAPAFSIGTVLDQDNSKTRAIHRKVAKNLIKSPDLQEDSKLLLHQNLKDSQKLQESLVKVYNHDIKKQLNAIILKNAKTVLVSTAISQNGKLDMLTILTVNLKMIKEMVLKCGFRPSFQNLGKLSVNILITALIAEGLEDMDINELFPNTSTSFLAEIPLIKPIMSSLMQGISNGLLTLRIGLVTRKYLFEDAKIKTTKEIRRSAIKESVLMLPALIRDSLNVFPQRIRKLFKKDKKEETA